MRSKTTLILLALVFGLPVFLAFILNIFWTPESTRNHGQLLEKAIHIEEVAFEDIDGEMINEDYFKGKWTLYSYINGNCDTACEAAMHDIRQVHLALGKEAHRVQRIWFVENMERQALEKLAAAYQGVRFILYQGESPLILKDMGDKGDELLMVDPRAYIFQRFTPSYDSRGVLKDMERLLTYSKQDKLTDIPAEEAPE